MLCNVHASSPVLAQRCIVEGHVMSWQRVLHQWTCYRKDQITKLKTGFHYPNWRPELTAWVDGWPVSITVNTGRVDGNAFPLAELTGPCQLGPSTWVVETGLNSGSHDPSMPPPTSSTDSLQSPAMSCRRTQPFASCDAVPWIPALCRSSSKQYDQHFLVTWANN